MSDSHITHSLISFPAAVHTASVILNNFLGRIYYIIQWQRAPFISLDEIFCVFVSVTFIAISIIGTRNLGTRFESGLLFILCIYFHSIPVRQLSSYSRIIERRQK